MRLLYVTDLHGSINKYNRILHIAREMQVDAVINDGDMLPNDGNGSMFSGQRLFISEFLSNHFGQFEESGIRYICMLGNDDLQIFDDLLSKTCSRYSYVTNVAQSSAVIDGYEFIGMNRVTDYPFRLKDRCRMDTLSFEFPRQYGTAVLSNESGEYQKIPDWPRYARLLPTIEDELELLPHPADYRKTVYIVHMPPLFLLFRVVQQRRE